MQQGNELSDNDVTTMLLLGAVALFAGPSAAAAVGLDAGAWLLAHDLLVPPARAVVQIPLVNAGLDWRRIVVASMVLSALLIGAVVVQKKPRK